MSTSGKWSFPWWSPRVCEDHAVRGDKRCDQCRFESIEARLDALLLRVEELEKRSSGDVR